MSGVPVVLITRPRAVAHALVSALEQAPVRVVAVPTVVTVPAPVGGPLDAAMASPQDWDWVVVTSALGATSLAAAARRCGFPLDRRPIGPRFAAIGPATARALDGEGLPVDLSANVPTGRGLAAALAARGLLDGQRVLLARADIAGRDLPVALCAAGAIVTEVVAYRTVEGPEESMEPLAAVLRSNEASAGVVASPSAVRGLLSLAGAAGLLEHARRLPLISIGPTTSSAIRLRRCTLAAEAAGPSVPALVDAVLAAVIPVRPVRLETSR